jgi:hypothetical protein
MYKFGPHFERDYLYKRQMIAMFGRTMGLTLWSWFKKDACGVASQAWDVGKTPWGLLGLQGVLGAICLTGADKR